MTRATKLRLRFAKRGDFRLVSHHDLMRCLERMIRRARLPLAMSQGFTPRPKVVFALALGLAIEGHNEVVDIEFFQPDEPADILRRLREVSPPGFTWLNAESLPAGAPAPRPIVAVYSLDLPPERLETARDALASLLGCTNRFVLRRRPDGNREQTIDVRSFLLDAELTDEGTLKARLKVTPEGSARPEELIETLGLRDLLDRGSILARTHVELA